MSLLGVTNDGWATLGLITGSLTGLLVFAKVFTSFAPFRWMWKRLVHDPVEEGLRSVILSEVLPLIEEVRDELRPNHGTSFRDAVDRLGKSLDEFKEYQHIRNHDVMNKLVVTNGRLELLDGKVDRYTVEDAATHDLMLGRLDVIDGGLREAKDLAAAVKHDLEQFNEIDTLGREGRIERRYIADDDEGET